MSRLGGSDTVWAILHLHPSIRKVFFDLTRLDDKNAFRKGSHISYCAKSFVGFTTHLWVLQTFCMAGIIEGSSVFPAHTLLTHSGARPAFSCVLSIRNPFVQPARVCTASSKHPRAVFTTCIYFSQPSHLCCKPETG